MDPMLILNMAGILASVVIIVHADDDNTGAIVFGLVFLLLNFYYALVNLHP